MSNFTNKIDFALIITVHKANPNGDPLSGNRPREDSEGFGEISDVCIKRKIRNRLQDMGENIFVQSKDRINDVYKCLKDRLESIQDKNDTEDDLVRKACEKWIDVRSFGQVIAWQSNKNKARKKSNEEDDQSEGSGVSIGIRGPVSIQIAESIDEVEITTMEITKSVKSQESTLSDTMGSKNRVEFGLYVIRGSINHQLAEKTGFSDEDAEKIKSALLTLFENDASSARPDGSMEVRRLYWWRHNSENGQYSSAKVQRTLNIKKKDNVEVARKFEDYEITTVDLDNLKPEVIEP